MTQNGPIMLNPAATPQYAVCRDCRKRLRLADAGLPLDEARCDCGARLHPYEIPVELTAPARGVLPRLIRFWTAGREDGFWGEHRFLRPAAAERAGVAPRQARFAYEAGRRAGARLREEARAHALRMARMRAKSAFNAAVAGSPPAARAAA